MVIQRWQSVFLLLAAIMMGCSCMLPLATMGEATLTPASQPVYLVLNALIAVLTLISIFLFKNLSRQKTVVKVNFFLIVASIITAGIMIFSTADASIDWIGAPLLVICSLVMTLAGYRRICADEKLLKSYDRIR